MLRGVTYSEFDNFVGPRLLYSHPPNILGAQFERFSDYVIVDKDLCEKIIIVRSDNIQFLNYPIGVTNKKYHRNMLSFSFGFILDVEADSKPFEVVLKKISNTFLSVEIEDEFLFQRSSKSTLPNILKALYEQLVCHSEAIVQINEGNILVAKLFRSPRDPIVVSDYDVPLLCCDRLYLSNIPWDIALVHILQQIDNVTFVKKIAKDAEMDIEYVRKAFQLMSYYGCIIMTDIFKFTNRYSLVRENVHMILNRNNSIFSEIVPFVYNNSTQKSKDKTPENPEQVMTRIANILLSFHGGIMVSNLYQDQKKRSQLQHIDIRRLIAIAQHHQLIRRVHEYPVYLFRSVSESITSDSKHTSPGLTLNPSDTNFNSLIYSPSFPNGPILSNGSTLQHSTLNSNLSAAANNNSNHNHNNNHHNNNHQLQSSNGLPSSAFSHNNAHSMSYVSVHSLNNDEAYHNKQASKSLLLEDIIESLDGSRCMDSICCEYGLSRSTVLQFPGISIVLR